MNWRRFAPSTIRQRVLTITLLPLLLITLLLGGYFISTQLQDAEDALWDRGKTMSMLLASSAEFGLLTRNREMLSSLMRGPSKEIDLSDIVFMDSDFNVIARANQYGPDISRDAAYPYTTDKEVFFLHPAIGTGIDVLDSPELQDEVQEPEVIGWVAISMSRLPTLRRQQEIILKGVSIAFIGFLITLFLAIRFSRRITTPILGLTQVVKALEQGRLDVRSGVHVTGELQTLSRGINRLAQRVQESNQTLESRVQRATTRLRSTLVHLERQNLALSAARKKADGANRAKDDFLARMSHELRTPLTSVLGFSRLLDKTELGGEQKEYSRIINQTSTLLLSIIDDILDFSKLQSNAITLEKLDINMASLLYDVIEMQAPAAHAKGLELIPLIAPDVPCKLVGDPMRISQILTNLISNAIKFTKEGEVAAYISVEQAYGQEMRLLIRVADTGVGIPKARIRHLFRAFSQADSSITRKFGGSGLGLVIAKLLAELMGGEIDLDSEENNGTTVSVALPLELPIGEAHPPAQVTTADPILVFDPHPSNRLSLEQQLYLCQPQPKLVASFSELQENLSRSHCLIWGLSPGETNDPALPEQLQAVLKAFNGGIALLCCETPETLTLPEQVTVLRKPARTQTLLDALLPGQVKLQAEHTTDEAQQIPARVLIAEDNNFNRLLLRRILEHHGAEVVTTTNGEDALSYALQETFDIVLMDVHMPRLDGIKATSMIKQHKPDLPVVALTANVIDSEHKKLMAAGIDRILFKPINDLELKRTLVELTRCAHTLDTDAPSPDDLSMLEQYQVSKEVLHEELRKQLAGLLQGTQHLDRAILRHHSHQLLGIAGLYELPELEVAGIELNRAIKQGAAKDIWREVWRLQRMIEHGSY